MVRLIVYALIVSVAAVFGQYEWTQLGLDEWGGAQALHDRVEHGIGVLTVALTILGARFPLPAIFLLGAMAGGMVTAPFAIAHALHG